MDKEMDLKKFESVKEQFNGNPYEATMYLAKKARRLAKETDNSIIDSQALTWALTGEKPKYINKHEFDNFRKAHSPEDILNYVSDETIVQSVNASLNLSRRHRELRYIYDESLSEEDKQRVTILTNMIWYHFNS